MNKPIVRIEATKQFQGSIKRLSKKYRHIGNDLKGLTEQLLEGETPGDQIQNVKYTVYKVRLKNSDTSKGKSGGYRVIYYIKTNEFILLLDIYVKSEQTDISTEQIKYLIDNYEKSED